MYKMDTDTYVCDFCEKDYIFGPDRLKDILKKSRALNIKE